jgi:hypothetical protein
MSGLARVALTRSRWPSVCVSTTMSAQNRQSLHKHWPSRPERSWNGRTWWQCRTRSGHWGHVFSRNPLKASVNQRTLTDHRIPHPTTLRRPLDQETEASSEKGSRELRSGRSLVRQMRRGCSVSFCQLQTRTAPRPHPNGLHMVAVETDCMAGHVRLELRNVVANDPFERSHRFAESSRILATETMRV